MRVDILGSGTSTGVPEIGCRCAVCTSVDPRDKRLRTSALIHAGDNNILIDCGPDFREQMLRQPEFKPINGVLITHEHYDHVGGIDDLRPFCQFGEIPIYAEHYTAEHLRTRLPYCLASRSYPGVPTLKLEEIEAGKAFYIGKTEILSLRVMHGELPILGYRIARRLGYITDMLTMPDESFDALKGIEVLIVNALRQKPHRTHQTVEQAVETAKRIGAKEAYFIHMSHHVGLHAEIDKTLPPHMHFAYDGMHINL